MRPVSASSAEQFARCPAGNLLPQHESYHAYTEAGADGHHMLCQVVNRAPGSAGRLEAQYPGLTGKLADYMDSIGGATGEDAFVVDVQARKSLYVGNSIGRKYEEALGRKLGRYELGASLDLRGSLCGTPWIRDFKFGVYSSWWQLYVQAMAVLWMPGVKSAEVDAGFLFIDTHDDDGVSLTDDTATVYLSDLDDRADEIMAAFARAEDLGREMEAGVHYSDLKVVEGKWCQYCGAFPSCPAKWKLAKSMLDLDVVHHIGALTTEQCGDAWAKLAEVKKNIIKPMEDALKMRMQAEGGFPTPDGKLYQLRTATGHTTINKERRAALLEVFPPAKDYFTKGADYTMVRKVNGHEPRK